MELHLTSYVLHVSTMASWWCKVSPWWEMEILNRPKSKKHPHLCIELTLQKYFSHPSLVIYFFATPPIKPKVGTAPTHRIELK